MSRNVARRDILYDLVNAVILANAANRHAEAGVEVTILDQNICAVRFRAD